MVALGRVQNGVVVLAEGVRLAEGQEVTVQPRAAVMTPPKHDPSPHSLLDVPPISLGTGLRQVTHDDDLLGEMLEDRR